MSYYPTHASARVEALVVLRDGWWAGWLCRGHRVPISATVIAAGVVRRNPCDECAPPPPAVPVDWEGAMAR